MEFPTWKRSRRGKYKFILRWCIHGDEESEDFYNGSGYEVNQAPNGSRGSRVGNFVLGQNKAWRIQILADQKELLHKLIFSNYVGGNALSGGRKIFIHKQKFINWLNEREIHSNIGSEKDNNDDRLVQLEEKTEELQKAITNMDSKLDVILQKLLSLTVWPNKLIILKREFTSGFISSASNLIIFNKYSPYLEIYSRDPWTVTIWAKLVTKMLVQFLYTGYLK